MIHYLIIRRDLPFGVTLAQLSHAAANSMEDWLKSELYVWFETLKWPDHKPMTVVVLGVRDELTLRRWHKKLTKRKVKHTVVKEPDGGWDNQLMAIGVWPGDRDKLEPVFKKLNTFSYDNWTGVGEEYEDCGDE